MRKVMLLLALLFALSSAAPTPLEPALEPALKELRSEDYSPPSEDYSPPSSPHGKRMLHMAYTLKNHFAHKPLTLIDAQVKDEELKAFFDSVDTNRDGFISPAELLDYFNEEIRKEVNEIMGGADIDRDGKVNYEEFVKSVTGTSSSPSSVMDEELKVFFNSIDTNQDGFISADELLGAFKTYLGEDFPRVVVDQLMGEADKNKDGKLNYEEFVIQMKGTCSLPRIPTTVSSPFGNLLSADMPPALAPRLAALAASPSSP